MDKITFLGAGSTVFAKNVLGDCMMTEPLREFEYALYDIDPERLEESYLMLSNINKNSNGQKARIVKYRDRREALRGARYVINAIQVGGYEPCTVTDFEIPKKYGLRQTIGDTVGIGGIFRALRTIPVMLDFAEDMEEVCPDALFLNYTNPMAMLTMAMLRASSIRTVGICHSVQVCVPQLLYRLGLPQDHVKYEDSRNQSYGLAAGDHAERRGLLSGNQKAREGRPCLQTLYERNAEGLPSAAVSGL